MGSRRIPMPWNAWVGLLAAANMASLFFFPRIEAVVVLAAMMLGAMIQAAIFNRKGFVKLLGAGHAPWIPMLIWIWTRAKSFEDDSVFYGWIVVLSVLNGLSLVIDAFDVVRYVRGDRKPHIG